MDRRLSTGPVHEFIKPAPVDFGSNLLKHLALDSQHLQQIPHPLKNILILFRHKLHLPLGQQRQQQQKQLALALSATIAPEFIPYREQVISPIHYNTIACSIALPHAMDVLQSPLEALVFNFSYASFGLLSTTVQSLLTFVAILTAVVCFWRIQAVGSNSSFRPTKSSSSSSSGDGDDLAPTFHFDGQSSSTPPLPVSSLSTPPPPYLLSSEKKPSEQQQEEDGCSTCNCPTEDAVDDENSNGFMAGESCRVKGKFTLYYSKELDKEDPMDDVDVDVVCSLGGPELLYFNVGRWSCDGIWGRRSGRGDLSWYRYQDLMVLNGSVVRLWECRR